MFPSRSRRGGPRIKEDGSYRESNRPRIVLAEAALASKRARTNFIVDFVIDFCCIPVYNRIAKDL